LRFLPVVLLAAGAIGLAQEGEKPYHVGGGVSPPHVMSHSEPEYTEEARRAGVNTTVILQISVGTDGVPADIQVKRGSGFGLDEKAVETVQSWRFEPAMKEGRPVQVSVTIEVNFRLLASGHRDQNARLSFNLADGVRRPRLIRGTVPQNPPPGGLAKMRIHLIVEPNGKVSDLHAIEATDQAWAEQAMHEMKGWRFRPSTLNGAPQQVEGIFELTFGRQRAPLRR
jgi:TonB family protein